MTAQQTLMLRDSIRLSVAQSVIIFAQLQLALAFANATWSYFTAKLSLPIG